MTVFKVCLVKPSSFWKARTCVFFLFSVVEQLKPM